VDVIQCAAQREQQDTEGNVIVPARTIRDLVKASLRDNPDRILIGEVRGAEALDLLDSANTGHAGSLSTLHTHSVFDALSQLKTMAAYADVPLPHRAIQLRIGNFADLVVHVAQKEQRCFVSEVIRVGRRKIPGSKATSGGIALATRSGRAGRLALGSFRCGARESVPHESVAFRQPTRRSREGIAAKPRIRPGRVRWGAQQDGGATARFVAQLLGLAV
jgi:Type II/IV secretion system protein